MRTGGCQCGDVRYEVLGEPVYHALCHCADCRAASGAPATAWSAFPADKVRVTQGAPTTYAGRGESRRQFCPRCGTGLLFTNDEALPGLIDIQSATFDDADAQAPGIQIQCAEKLAWFDGMSALPAFERYPEAPA